MVSLLQQQEQMKLFYFILQDYNWCAKSLFSKMIFHQCKDGWFTEE